MVQLEDKQNNLIAPFTLAESVALSNGKNAQEQMAYMDIGVIKSEEVSVLASLGDAADAALDEIETLGEPYQEGIDSLSEKVETLDTYVFPLTLTYSITPDFSNYTNRIRCVVGEYPGSIPTLTETYIERSVNNGSPVKIYNPQVASSDIDITVPISGMKEEFTFMTKTTKKTTSASELRYMCFYGPSTAAHMTSDIAQGLTKIMTQTVSFNPTITTTYGQYIWLIVPSYLSINKVRCSGFDVTLNPYESVNIAGFGTYKAYRTLNALDDASWSLVIS